jgi:hypothetical protein
LFEPDLLFEPESVDSSGRMAQAFDLSNYMKNLTRPEGVAAIFHYVIQINILHSVPTDSGLKILLVCPQSLLHFTQVSHLAPPCFGKTITVHGTLRTQGCPDD